MPGQGKGTAAKTMYMERHSIRNLPDRRKYELLPRLLCVSGEFYALRRITGTRIYEAQEYTGTRIYFITIQLFGEVIIRIENSN